MKKIISIILVILIVLSTLSVTVSANEIAYDTITSAKTPKTSLLAKLSWTKGFGGSVYTSPTPPIVAKDTLLVVSQGTLYKLDKNTGKEIKSVALDGKAGFNQVPILYAENKIFVQMTDGIIKAFDYETMKQLWVYEDTLGGQANSPIVYSDGYIYTGFFMGEEKNANFVCVSTTDENPSLTGEKKAAKWVYTNKGGYYGVGAFVSDKYVFFGSDDGQDGSEGTSKLISIEKKTGKVVDIVKLKGDLRSSAVYSNSRIYISSKAGYLYGVLCNLSNGNIAQTIIDTYKADGKITCAPLIYNSRVYISASNGSTGDFIVLEQEGLKLAYKAQMLGVSKTAMLLSNAYQDENGKVYIYTTYNQKPGGITVFTDEVGQKSASQTQLYTPQGNYSQYGISNITADENGTLYYKNDSGYIFCIEKRSQFDFVGIINAIITATILRIVSFFKIDFVL